MKEAKNVQFQEWNIKMLKVVWISTFLACITAIILFIRFDDFENCSRETYFYTFVAVPTMMQCIVCVIMEIFVRYISKYVPQNVTAMVVALGLELDCGVMVMVHTSVGSMALALVIPVVLATVYNSRLILVAQSIMACVIYAITQLLLIPNAVYMPDNDAFVYIIIFVALLLAVDVWMDMLIKWQIGINDEVEEYRQRDMELEKVQKRDSLTGLWNHKAFVEQLGQVMKQVQALSGKCVLVLFDIDGLYRANEQYGYTCGDEVIVKLTEIIKRNVRAQDYIARYNGEEFMLILNEATVEVSCKIAERIQKEFGEYAFESCGGEHFSVSIGIAQWRDEYTGNLDFLSKVEQAVRLAKVEGYGRIGVYDN